VSFVVLGGICQIIYIAIAFRLKLKEGSVANSMAYKLKFVFGGIAVLFSFCAAVVAGATGAIDFARRLADAVCYARPGMEALWESMGRADNVKTYTAVNGFISLLALIQELLTDKGFDLDIPPTASKAKEDAKAKADTEMNSSTLRNRRVELRVRSGGEARRIFWGVEPIGDFPGGMSRNQTSL